MINECDALYFFGIRVLIATVCGLIIGIERELKNKVAGIRTNVLICVGSSILTGASFYIFKNDPSADPTRIIGQIITGIGFLGAGVIYMTGDKVVGVTTAAFIWIMAAIGVLVGMGFILTPIVLTFGLLIIAMAFHLLEKRINNNNKPK